MSRSEFRNNHAGPRVGDFTGYPSIIDTHGSWLDVSNSAFANNMGTIITYGRGAGGTVTYSSFAGNPDLAVANVSGADAPMIISNNVFGPTRNLSPQLFIDAASSERSYLFNNHFQQDPGRRILMGVHDLEGVRPLNGLEFASQNRGGNIQFLSIQAGNLRLSPASPAIDVGVESPLPNPVSEIECVTSDDCVAANAMAYWSQPADTCLPQLGLCGVDVSRDSDRDGAPDWLETIAVPVDPLGPANAENPARRTVDFQPSVDFDGTSRPQGDGFDLGAFEFTPGP